jgi:hypothetical protein
MKALILCLVITMSASWIHAAEVPDPALTKQITAILFQCEKLSHGATRAELLEYFTTEGGLSSAAGRIYASRLCRYIKIQVTFDLSGSDKTVESPADTIKTISKPYLEFSIID